MWPHFASLCPPGGPTLSTMIKHPAAKYRPFPPIALSDRRWPSRVTTQAPVWMSTDLRDGNQALFEPMSVEKKLRLFKTLCAIGLKEIEVAFPSASQTDFDFVRMLIEDGHVPADVTLVVLTQAREHLIRRTMEALRGAPKVIVHFYVATAPTFRDVVFRLSKDEVVTMAVDAVKLIRTLMADLPGTDVRLEYSPEVFSGTELEFSKQICDAVVEASGATAEHKIVLNLPATVELASPNVYADQVEWMHRNLARREAIILSVHPHNDRGAAVAAAELAMLAGAERVEGCLFGNGERTGNVDLVTLALNLYTQGVDPQLDFSDINEVARTVEDCTQLPIHPRHPYVGDLVFTAFSGSHQDAIKKGFAASSPDGRWQVPYLPIDPKDLGRTYDSVIRINGQSGKGGIAYILETVHGMALPLRLQVELSGVVQRHADASGGEITPGELWRIFSAEYLEQREPIAYVGHKELSGAGGEGLELEIELGGKRHVVTGHGNGPLDALVHALRLPIRLQSYEERATGMGADSQAAAFVELALEGSGGPRFGVGVHTNIVTASILAILSAVNRGFASVDPTLRKRLIAQIEASSTARPRAVGEAYA